MATVVAYHTSLYGFNFGVHPQFRRMGFGRRIMHEAQLYALTLGLHQISATIDASEPRLLNYYVSLGARVVTSGAPLRNQACCVLGSEPRSGIRSWALWQGILSTHTRYLHLLQPVFMLVEKHFFP